ncbi:MAG: VWA domain-containing protein [Armatimonadetes bacterium]|nr:VWA domain-containing protein [Armatimonadota bacterium]
MQNQAPEISLAIAQFVRVLRLSGVRVSVAETMDAYRALAWIDLLDRRQVRAALQALLIKNPSDRPVFDRAFDLFFLSGEAKEELFARWRRQKEAEEQKLAAAGQELAQLFQPWEDYIPEKYRLTRENLQTFTRLPAREQKRLKELIAQMRGNPVNNPGELVARVVQAALNYWRYYLLKREAEEKEVSSPEDLFPVSADFYRDPGEQILYADLQNIQDEQLPKMTALIRRLSARLARRLSRRYRQSRRSRAIDFRRTIRQNIRFGGTPLELRYRGRRPKRPRLVLICDVSASMARYSRFVLQFIYGLNSAGQKIESFVFSEDLERVTPCFERRRDFAATMTDLMNESRQWGQTTNFYLALETFRREYKKLIAPDAVFIIVSDTRTVCWEQAAGLLGEMARKVRDVIWLNPVPAAGWSGLPAAAFRKCAQMYECYSLYHLEKIFRKKIPG